MQKFRNSIWRRVHVNSTEYPTWQSTVRIFAVWLRRPARRDAVFGGCRTGGSVRAGRVSDAESRAVRPALRINFYTLCKIQSANATRGLLLRLENLREFWKERKVEKFRQHTFWNLNALRIRLKKADHINDFSGDGPARSRTLTRGIVGWRGGSVKIKSHSLKTKWTSRGSFSAVPTLICASKY